VGTCATLPFSLGRFRSQPNTTQTASWSVYPFLHGSRLYPADRPSYNDSNKPYVCNAYRCGLEMYKILGKTTVMGLCDIHNSNSNKKNKKKTKNKMYTPHHTISHKHTHTPQGWKRSKNRRKFLACMQTVVYITRTPGSTSTQLVSREKHALERPRILPPFLLPLHILRSVHWLERTRTIQPVWRSLRIQYHFTTSY